MNNAGKPERLDKILSNAGCGSRTDVKKMIRSGAAACDGVVVIDPEMKFAAESTRITVGGVPINYSRYIYLMMNKPPGVVSATYDQRRKTVLDLVPDFYRARGVFPVGRLDADTTGLLLLTDDGDLAHRLLSPKNHVEKEYMAVLDKKPGAEVVEGFARGVELKTTGRLRPAALTPVDETQPPVSASTADAARTPGPATAADDACTPGPASARELYQARVIVTEGKFHQIKRMFLAYGIRVVKLERVRMGPLCLDPALEAGGSRELTAAELSLLRRAASTAATAATTDTSATAASADSEAPR